MKKQVWLNLVTGQFGRSWDPKEYADMKHYDDVMAEQIRTANDNNWKLIEYECINDPSFEFYDMMKIR